MAKERDRSRPVGGGWSLILPQDWREARRNEEQRRYDPAPLGHRLELSPQINTSNWFERQGPEFTMISHPNFPSIIRQLCFPLSDNCILPVSPWLPAIQAGSPWLLNTPGFLSASLHFPLLKATSLYVCKDVPTSALRSASCQGGFLYFLIGKGHLCPWLFYVSHSICDQMVSTHSPSTSLWTGAPWCPG